MALLLEQGRADVNATACGCAPLHRAAYNGKLDACRMLLDNGALASLRISNWNGVTPLQMAVLSNRLRVLNNTKNPPG